MPYGNLVASAVLGDSTYNQANDKRQEFVMSDGRRLAIFGVSGGAGGLSYSSSADGVTWSAPAAVGTVTDNLTLTGATQQGNVLYLWCTTTSTPFTLTIVVATYNPGTQTITSTASSQTMNAVAQTDATWDAGNGVFHVAVTTGATVSMGAWNPSTPSNPISVVPAYRGTSPVISGVVLAGSSILLLVQDVGNGLTVATATYSGGTYSSFVGEAPFSGTQSITGAACALDTSGILNIVYVSGPQLYAIRRTGTRVFSAGVNLAGAVSSDCLSLVTNGADLVVLYQSTANQANGEIYLVWRQQGTWGQPTRFAGGDSAGYAFPKAVSTVTSGRVDAIYQSGSAIYAANVASSSTPNTPIVTAPSGTVSGTTPTITWTYTNPNAPTDPQSAVEVLVMNVSASTVAWDSGKISQSTGSIVYGTGSNTSDANYVAPVALVNGTQYSTQVRTWDQITNAASPWSTAVSFHPWPLGNAVITALVANGTTFTSSPAAVSGATLTSTTVSWSQPNGHSASQYRQTLYAADGVTILAQTGWTLFGTPVASGSLATVPSWSPPMATGVTYVYEVDLLDSVVGMYGGARWTLTTAFTPPAGVTGLVVVPNPAGGSVTLTWVNPPGVG